MKKKLIHPSGKSFHDFDQIFRIMKLVTLILFVAILQISAATYSQTTLLKISGQNLSIGQVFENIEKQSEFSFFYNINQIDLSRKVDVEADNQVVNKILDDILSGTDLTYTINNRLIIIHKQGEAASMEAVSQQSRKVSGKVTDKAGASLPGVSVAIKGTTTGTITDSGGSYSFASIPGNAVLQFSFIGMKMQEIMVENKSTINIILEEETVGVDEVVVVGYGSSSRKKLTSAVTSVKADELNKGPISDVGQLLQGKVPGLNISSSGDPNRNASVILRGASTLNSSQGPFYVIDGVPGVDISMIAPDDIATIEILKDAAATAIYGNRAANGVIMITSKKGKKGQMQVTYSGYVTTETVSNQLDMMNATQLTDFVKKNGLSFTPADNKGANTNWQKAVEKSSAFSQNHNLSFSGGNEHSTYNASVNYMTKEGIILNSDMQRIIAHLAMEQFAFNDKVKFSLNVSNSNNSANDVPYRNTVLLQSALYLPVSPVKNGDDTYFQNFVKSGYYNPVAMLNHSQMNTKTNLLIGSFNTQVKLPFGLTYDLNLSFQNSSYLFGSYLDKYFTTNYVGMYDNPDPGSSGHTLQTFGKNGQANRSSFQDTKKLLETFVTWDKKIGDHTINAVIGYSYQDNVIGDGFDVTTSNFPVDNTAYNNLTLSTPAGYNNGLYFGQGTRYERSLLISDFGRLNYSYKDKYLIQGSLRRDGSSVFGKNNQWGIFPSIGGAWRISQEGFMKKQQLFNDLKLRVSYGVTGNATGFNAYTAQFISGGMGTYYYNGVGLTSAYGPTQAANFDLQWEKTATSNIGFDFTILKGKVSGSVDWYNKNTTGMIYGYKVDPMLVPTGNITANGGSINNKGIELSLNLTPVEKKDFVWRTNFNLAHNKNVITSLRNPLFQGGDSVRMVYPEGSGQSGSSLQVLKEGHPLGQFLTLQYAGKDASGVSQFIDAHGKLTTAPTSADFHYAGDAQPKFLLGWTNTFRYKAFDLSIFIRGVFGNKIFDATRADLFRPTTAMSTNILVDAANESPKDGNAFRYSDRFIENGSYIRFDNATLGYAIKDINKYVKNLRIYATVNNLFTITGYKGVDPEVNQGGIAPGVDYNNFYPKTRTLLLGVNISF